MTDFNDVPMFLCIALRPDSGESIVVNVEAASVARFVSYMHEGGYKVSVHDYYMCPPKYTVTAPEEYAKWKAEPGKGLSMSAI